MRYNCTSWVWCCAIQLAVLLAATTAKDCKECTVEINHSNITLCEATKAFEDLQLHPGLVNFTVTSAPCNGMFENRTWLIRPRSTDWAVVLQVLVTEQFQFLDRLPAKPRTILDLGVNMGASASYFGLKYPEATVVGLEPSRTNFMLANANSNRYKNVFLHLGAVWPEEGYATFHKGYLRERNEWGYIVQPLQETASNINLADLVVAFSVPGLMRRHNWTAIDFLKVDIECTEFELFSPQSIESGWLNRVNCMTVEMHPWCPESMHRGRSVDDVKQAIINAGVPFVQAIGELSVFCRALEKWVN